MMMNVMLETLAFTMTAKLCGKRMKIFNMETSTLHDN